MTIPNFLSSSFAPYRYATERITDVASCLTTLRTELTALGWAETPPLSNIYYSPADASGRYMIATFSKTSATRLQVALANYTPPGPSIALMTRAMDISGTADIFYYTGKFHFFVQSLYSSGTGEFVAGWLIDCTPDALPSCPYPVVGDGSRNSSGTLDGFGVVQYMIALDNGSPVPVQRMKGPVAYGGTVVTMSMASGRGFFDEYLISQNVGGTWYWTGRLCQTLLGPGTPRAIGLELQVPIDDGTMATFKATSLVDTNYQYRLFMRKS